MKIKIFIFTLLVSFLASCMTAIPIPENKKDYIWTWKSNEVMLVIKADWFIDYKKESWSTSTSVNGPITQFNNEDFIVSVLGIESEFDIEKTPFTNDNWEIQMVLEWNTLTKQSWNVKIKSEEVKKTKLDIPDLEELNSLVKNTISIFNKNVEIWDFTDFHSKISEFWKKQITVEELNTAFENIIKNKDIVLKSWSWDIVFKNDAYLDDNEILVLEWHITWEVVVNFKLEYISENWKWELYGIVVNYN